MQLVLLHYRLFPTGEDSSSAPPHRVCVCVRVGQLCPRYKKRKKKQNKHKVNEITQRDSSSRDKLPLPLPIKRLVVGTLGVGGTHRFAIISQRRALHTVSRSCCIDSFLRKLNAVVVFFNVFLQFPSFVHIIPLTK